MMLKLFCLLGVCLLLTAGLPGKAFAENQKIPPVPAKGSPRDTVQKNENPKQYTENKNRYKSKYFAEQSFKDQVLERFSFGRDVKGVWDVVDGEKDIYFRGLRAESRNLGLSYTLDDMEYLDDVRLKFSAGKDNEISFTTQTIPFVGQLEGFTFKATAGDDGGKVFARYKINLY